MARVAADSAVPDGDRRRHRSSECDLGDTACGARERSDASSRSVYVLPEQRDWMPGPFARAGESSQLFARLVGPFPYEKLAHLQSSTRFGGMENASAIFYADAAFRSIRMSEGLIAHETAHQWFGDAVTEREWAHLWLSEGSRRTSPRCGRAPRAATARSAREWRGSAAGARRYVGAGAPGDRHRRRRTISRCSIATATRRADLCCRCCTAGGRQRLLRRVAGYYAKHRDGDGAHR